MTMNREYIDREVVSEGIRKYYYKNPPNSSYQEGFDNGLDKAQRVILDASVADVAEVVRCKDCKWYSELACGEGELLGSQGWCNEVMARPMPSNGFCSFGERENNG